MVKFQLPRATVAARCGGKAGALGHARRRLLPMW